jgi:hypothetical protein
MAVTVDDIMAEYDSLFNAVEHEVVVEKEFNEDGTVKSETKEMHKGPADPKEQIKLLVKAMLIKIKDNGIDMGNSTATKLDVG